MMNDSPVDQQGQQAKRHNERLVISRFQGTNYCLFSYCTSSETVPTSQQKSTSPIKNGSFPPVRYFMRKVMPLEKERRQHLARIFEIRRQQQMEQLNGHPLQQDTSCFTVSQHRSKFQLVCLHLQAATTPRCCSLTQLLKDHAVQTKPMAVETKVTLMMEALGKAPQLFHYSHFIPSLDNLIVDPQHHLTPNLMSTTGLNLLLWGESISSKEFKQIVHLLPTNALTLPIHKRVSQPMLCQKAIANIVLSLILDSPVTYTGQLKGQIDTRTAETTLKKMQLFFKTFLKLGPVKKKIQAFAKRAKMDQVDPQSRENRSKLESFIYNTFVEQKPYTYVQIWDALRLNQEHISDKANQSSQQVLELDKKLQKIAQFIWDKWPDEKRNFYLKNKIINDASKDYQMLLMSLLRVEMRITRKHHSLAGFIINASYCKAKEEVLQRLLNCVLQIREYQLQSKSTHPPHPSERPVLASGGSDQDFKQSQPRWIAAAEPIKNENEAIKEIFTVMGGFVNHNVQDQKLVMQDQRSKSVRQFLKGLHL